MGNRIDLTGHRFGRLVVLERAEDHITKSGKNVKRWNCLCDCGNKTIVRHGNLRNGKTTSCGRLHKEKVGAINRTHGLSTKHGRLYPLWKSIKYRCYNKNAKSYKDYGGRGIKMCDISNSPAWEYNGEKLRVVEWAERLGVTPHCLLHRKELGWDIERILTTPLKGDNNGKAKL